MNTLLQVPIHLIDLKPSFGRFLAIIRNFGTNIDQMDFFIEIYCLCIPILVLVETSHHFNFQMMELILTLVCQNSKIVPGKGQICYIFSNIAGLTNHTFKHGSFSLDLFLSIFSVNFDVISCIFLPFFLFNSLSIYFISRQKIVL